MSQTDTIGIVGGGQLGRMLSEAATTLHKNVMVVDPTPNSPAAQVGARQIVATFDDEQAIKELSEKSSVITIESEHVDAKLLKELSDIGNHVHPDPSTIRTIQDKFIQKKFLQSAGLPIADFVEITDQSSAISALQKFGGKMLIKTRFGAYDGRGNMVISSQADIEKAFSHFEGKTLYAEKFVPFTKELAVMIARDANGIVITYPVVETKQERNICIEVLAPAQISKEAYEAAETIALSTAEHLEGSSVFGIEMFLTKEATILINEIAPRVHNSGHYTIEACETSQFEQHIRAISGLPLGATDMITPAAVMINILGERDGETHVTGLKEAEAIDGVTIHLYGKSPTKIDRKMGHITAVGATIEEAEQKATQARTLIGI